MSLASMLHTTCTIQRDTATKDASGGKVQSLSTLVEDEPCDIQPVSAEVSLEYRKKELKVSHSIYFARDVEAREYDKVVSGSRSFVVVGYRPGAQGYGDDWPSVLDVDEHAS